MAEDADYRVLWGARDPLSQELLATEEAVSASLLPLGIRQSFLAAAREVGQAFREIIGSYNAAMTAVQVTALIEDRAKVEIEATAVLPDQPST